MAALLTRGNLPHSVFLVPVWKPLVNDGLLSVKCSRQPCSLPLLFCSVSAGLHTLAWTA